MVASDGWLLASDTLEVQGHHPGCVRTSSHTRKIRFDRRSGVAYVASGEELERSVAADIAREHQSTPFDFDDLEGTRLRIAGLAARRW